jgi:hypothetical protein
VAITVTARQDFDGALTAAGNQASSSTTPTANSLLLTTFGVFDNGAGNPVLSTPTGGSLTYTLIAKDGENDLWQYDGLGTFAAGAGAWRAQVGGSPSSFAVTVDGTSGTANHFISCFDVTGHNLTAPIRQSAVNGASVGSPGDSEVGTVTLASTPQAGNVIVSFILSGNSVSTVPTSPTAGSGKAMTANIYTGSTGFRTDYRTCDATESATITCPDLGTGVGCWVMVAFEINIFVAPAGLNINQAVKTASYF